MNDRKRWLECFKFPPVSQMLWVHDDHAEAADGL
jgi:hypothetical protein